MYTDILQVQHMQEAFSGEHNVLSIEADWWKSLPRARPRDAGAVLETLRVLSRCYDPRLFAWPSLEAKPTLDVSGDFG